MRIVVAFDSFKGSLSSIEAGEAAKKGILRVIPDAEVLVCPMADGGEGTVDAMIEGLGATAVNVEVHGPLMEKVTASYGILPDGITAVMEMAQAAGLTLVKEEERNPLYTTTYGVGEMIKDAIGRGCRKFYIGIGGSATNDGGTGMLKALGYRFMDISNREIQTGAQGLEHLATIDNQSILPELKECEFHIACDVNNPLCGELGCSRVFAPQKGAKEESISQMDSWLSNYAKLAKTINPNADADAAGSGAAGGLGFAFQTFLNGRLQSGSLLVIEMTGLKEKIEKADLVITGEGRIDGQTAFGKAPAVVANMAKQFGIPVIAFAGAVSATKEELKQTDFDECYPITEEILPLEEAMKRDVASRNLEKKAEEVIQGIKGTYFN